MKKVFTIIICAYNAENRIEETIDSIIKQNFYNDLVCCLLLVDNNSQDNTVLLMKEYEQKYDNIKYIFEARQGLSFARLAGVNETNTKWIVFIDDDNILDKNWLNNAYKYINKNEKVGAFNGAVIPLIEQELNSENKMVLKVIYRGLACTHLNKNDIDYKQAEHPAQIPFGAGLVIRTDALKEMANDGWIKVAGRKGGILSSGEDTEMCLYVKGKGYVFGYNPQMLLEHMIPLSRLDQKYAMRLWEGFAEYCLYRESMFENRYSLFYCIKKVVRYFRSKIYSQLLFSKMKRLKWSLQLQIDRKILLAIFKDINK